MGFVPKAAEPPARTSQVKELPPEVVAASPD
jgi:hypothetical protein